MCKCVLCDMKGGADLYYLLLQGKWEGYKKVLILHYVLVEGPPWGLVFLQKILYMYQWANACSET